MMKKFITSKFFIGLICFCLGFFTSRLFSRVNTNTVTSTASDERIPVDPSDFDQHKMMDIMSRMERDMMAGSQAVHSLTDVKRKEDDKFVYFDVPLNEYEKDHKLKVSVKDGMISIAENSSNSESERQFSIEPGLDEARADVETLKDRVRIKIPKKE